MSLVAYFPISLLLLWFFPFSFMRLGFAVLLLGPTKKEFSLDEWMAGRRTSLYATISLGYLKTTWL